MSRCVRSTHLIACTRTFQLASCKRDRALDDTPLLDDTDKTCHGNASDADVACKSLEDGFGRHVGYTAHLSKVESRIESLEHAIAQKREKRHEHKPHKSRTSTDDGGILESDDITETEHSRTGVDAEHELGFLCKIGTSGNGTC